MAFNAVRLARVDAIPSSIFSLCDGHQSARQNFALSGR